MLPNRRRARVTGRSRKETNSIAPTTGRSASGAPIGQNSLKKPRPFLAKPTTSTRPKVRIAKVTVTASCEVAVKVMNMPRMFITRIRVNRVKMKGKYLRPSWPMIESVRLSIMPNRLSPAA